MLLRFIRQLKNRFFKQESKPKKVNEMDLNWIWQPFETADNVGFSARVKKIVSAIVESSPNDIPETDLELNPRIVIPLCAIQLQNEINWSKLSSFKNKLEEDLIKRDLNARIEFIDEVLNDIDPSPRWRYLFKSLTPQTQFALLSRLIKYRRPNQDDWRNIFEEIEYEFKTSPEYLVVLIVVFLLCLAAILEMFTIMLIQPESWLNGFMIVAILIVITFLIVLWQETHAEEEKLEATLLMELGVFGVLTFAKEWQRLLKKNLVWEGITTLYGALISVMILAGIVNGAAFFAGIVYEASALPIVLSEAVAGALFWTLVLASTGAVASAGAWVGAVTGALFWAVALSLTLALASTGAVAVAVAGFFVCALICAWVWVEAVAVDEDEVGAAGAVFWAMSWTVALIVALIVAGAGAWFFALLWAGPFAAGWGLGFWYDAKEKRDLGWMRFFSILAFPWFCSCPIMVGFTSFALYDRLSWGWQAISLFWLIVLGFCSILWVRGKKLEEKARNPLKSTRKRS